MKKLFIYATAALLTFGCAACGDSDDEPQKIEFIKGQTDNVTYTADDEDATVFFHASASWSAWTATSPDSGPVTIDWIILDDDFPHGSAGDANIHFRLSPNNTGADRTAYIVIVCEDYKSTVKITQTSDSDDQNATPSGIIEIACKSFYIMDGNYYEDGITNYFLSYERGLPKSMITKWRDDIVSGPSAEKTKAGDSYCLTTQTYDFVWSTDRVSVSGKEESVYFPSERHELEDESIHEAQLTDGLATSGWYRWSDDDIKTEWSAEYNGNRQLEMTHNNDPYTYSSTSRFTWENGCLKRIDAENGVYITFTYGDASLVNQHTEFDINWVLPTELEFYDFAAGDISKIFTSCGIMGKPSRLLFTEITEHYPDGRTISYRMNYKTNTTEKTEVNVECYSDGHKTSYREWEFKFHNIK